MHIWHEGHIKHIIIITKVATVNTDSTEERLDDVTGWQLFCCNLADLLTMQLDLLSVVQENCIHWQLFSIFLFATVIE